MANDLATVEDVEKAWRPLTTVEKERAGHYIGQASRKIRRRWRDVDARIADPSDDLTSDDVKDVVIDLVLSVIPTPVVGARSWSQTTGPYAHSVTLPSSQAAGPMSFQDWMIEVFDTESRNRHAAAQFDFPAADPWPDAAFGAARRHPRGL